MINSFSKNRFRAHSGKRIDTRIYDKNWVVGVLHQPSGNFESTSSLDFELVWGKTIFYWAIDSSDFQFVMLHVRAAVDTILISNETFVGHFSTYFSNVISFGNK